MFAQILSLGLGSIMVSISACHAEDLGSIPSRDVVRFPFSIISTQVSLLLAS